MVPSYIYTHTLNMFFMHNSFVFNFIIIGNYTLIYMHHLYNPQQLLYFHYLILEKETEIYWKE